MTVAIAAITGSGHHIVTASDRMISSGDVINATDDATLKERGIARAWGLMFAGDANLFLPLVNSIKARLDQEAQLDLDTVQSTVLLSYTGLYDTEFTSRYLSQYNINSITTFLNIGLSQFGRDRFSQICDQIESFDLGIDVIGYGFDKNRTAHIFQVSNPGKITNHDLLGHAVVGSGVYMAMAALWRKRLPYNLDATAYRVLDAKFSAETASGVGKSTSLFSLDQSGNVKNVGYGSLEKIKEIWEKTMQVPEPADALNIISTLLK